MNSKLSKTVALFMATAGLLVSVPTLAVPGPKPATTISQTNSAGTISMLPVPMVLLRP